MILQQNPHHCQDSDVAILILEEMMNQISLITGNILQEGSESPSAVRGMYNSK